MAILSRLVLIAVLASLLVGCGYQLRGGDSMLAPDYERLEIRNLDAGDPLYRALTERLSDAGIVPVPEGGRAAAALIFTRNDLVDRVAIVDARAQPREYEWTQTVAFRVENRAGEVLLPEYHIAAARPYGYDPVEVLGSVGNEQVARQELAEDVARLVFYRLLARPDSGPSE
ncbi:MAG: LPS assembly lipoprotein LptE [Halothiobacillaceae bacterium]